MNGELARIGYEVVLAYFRALSQHRPDETEKRQKIAGSRTGHLPKSALCKNIAVRSELSAVSVELYSSQRQYWPLSSNVHFHLP